MAQGRTYRCKAIVLDTTKLGETDLILTLLADSGKQVRAVAKGARKPGGRLAARCQVFSVVDLLLARGRALDVVSQAELVEAPLSSAPSYEQLMAASAVSEVAKLCSFEDAEDPFVFPVTARALAVMGQRVPTPLDGQHLDLICAAYVFKLLSHMGYRPDLSGCVACGDPAPSYFSASAGGVLCASCAKDVPGAEEVDANTLLWLRALINSTFAELADSPVDPALAARLLAFAHLWAATHLDVRLRTFEFLFGC